MILIFNHLCYQLNVRNLVGKTKKPTLKQKTMKNTCEQRDDNFSK